MSPERSKSPSQREFVALMAMLFAGVALSIDAMLPALPHIAADLSPDQPNRAQLVVGLFFAGMGVGTLVAGPVSDAIGRKATLMICAVTFVLGAGLSAMAPSLEMLLAARFLQGLGAAGPRAAGMAMVRDLYRGRDMARIISLVMTIFTLVPALAPLMGQGVMLLGSWRLIFVAFILFGLGVHLWLGLRQPETLAPADRRPLQFRLLWQATQEMFANPTARLSILCQSLSLACLVSVLSSQQSIFAQHFDREASFPMWFGIIAVLSIAGAIVNARLVTRIGMRGMVRTAYALLAGLTALILLSLALGLMPAALEFPAHVLWSVAIFANMGLTMGNLNAMAMEDLGHIAGLAASLMTAAATVLSVLLAIPVGQAFAGTQVPLMAGVLVFSTLALGLMLRAGRRG
jgi:MFS transporter, DHA1 family, multidrug resistance protein